MAVLEKRACHRDIFLSTRRSARYLRSFSPVVELYITFFLDSSEGVCYLITRVFSYHPVCYSITRVLSHHPCYLINRCVILSRVCFVITRCVNLPPDPVCYLITRVFYYHPVCYLITRVLFYHPCDISSPVCYLITCALRGSVMAFYSCAGT